MSKSFTLEELATLTGAKLIGDSSVVIRGINELKAAKDDDASFLANPRYLELMKKSSAGVICVDQSAPVIDGQNYLVDSDPSRTFQQIAEAFLKSAEMPSAFNGIHESATVAQGVEIGEDVTIGPHSSVDSKCSIGSGTVLHPNVTIGCNVTIGEGCTLYPGVVVREGCRIGNRVVLQPGVVVGSCGFGYTPDSAGHHVKLEQVGTVVIEDDVEIGANACIDRARFKSTVIGRGTKIDNLVQIGHNVELGQDNIIVAQTGVAGSSKTGRHVMMGGQVGILGHIELADGVQIATRGGVSKSITKPGPYRGSPAIPLDQYNRYKVLVRGIEKHVKRIEALEKRIKELEES